MMKLNREPRSHPRKVLPTIFIICSVLLTALVLATWAFAIDRITDELQRRLESDRQPGELRVGCELIHANADLIAFYSERQFAPLWVNEQGPNELGKALPGQLADARLHGLNPNDYHLHCINATINRINSILSSRNELEPKELADLDIMMTDSFMIYTSHLATGKVDPERLYPLWFSEKEKANIVTGLNDLLQNGDLAETIRNFAPSHEQYWRLVEAGQRMEQVIAAGGWPVLPQGQTLRPGDRNPHVILLRERLQASGESGKNVPAGEPDLYDTELEVAVKKFQFRHGLAIDGAVGPNTREELNIPAERRRQQILLNLERWRWLPHKWTDNYIIVNTAAFSLNAHRDNENLSMRVIVGKDYQKTPVFSETMRYIEINPYWNVPRSIAVKELLPQIKRNPGYAAGHNYQILSGEGPINPWLVDWSTISARNFPWRIRQKPGAKNALGRIKFMFPNRFHVYMHDTPDRHLFKRARRAFSHGCIRLEKPVDLALLILRDDPAWTRERLEQLIQTGKRRVVNIDSAWMVHVLYWTSWVDEYGQLQFCPDIYDRDPVLWQALNKNTGGEQPMRRPL